MKKPPYFFSAIVGNVFEHYDKFLFSFLAPFLAPLFFQSNSPLLSLILTFAIMPLSLLSRPIGALLVGKIGDSQGRKKALMITLIGMAITTVLMGLLPTYSQVGWLAPLLLILVRLMQNFFAAGELTGGALLILEHCDPKKHAFFSSMYDCSSILGILIASAAVTFLAQLNLVETHWRILYFLGAFTAFIGISRRSFIQEEQLSYKKEKLLPTYQIIWREKRLFLILCLGVGFSCAIYESVTTLMNGYLPFVSKISQTNSIQIGTWILVIDLLLLPLFGCLFIRISYQKTMLVFLILTSALSIPLFNALSHANSITIWIVRILFILFGVGFSAPLYAWSIEIAPRKYRYTFIALSQSIGSLLFGETTSPLSLWLFQLTGWGGVPGIYLTTLGVLTLFATQNLLRTQSTQAKLSSNF